MSEREIFLVAVEIADPQRRAAYLDQVCGGDPALRRGLDTLLAAHERSGEFLDVPAVEQMNAAARANGNAATASDANEPDAIHLSFLTPSSVPGHLGRLDHYEILEIIGGGGYGVVLKGYDEKLHRTVAIKVMAGELAITSPARKRFLREARATAAIRHENVVGVHAVAEKPLPFFVMDFIDGPSLQQKLDQTGPLDIPDVVNISVQIARGLAAAHAVRLIHRDIKPANILLEHGTDRVRITDFGLARTVDDASLTRSGLIAGTPLYMSPEQAQGLTIDQRSDLFSLGSVMYVMTSGHPPFRAATALAVLKRVTEDQPRPISEILSDVPDWLVAFIAKLQSKNPVDRFSSAAEVVELLTRCQREFHDHGRVVSMDPISARAPSVIPRAESRPRRSGIGIAVIALAALLIGVALTEITGALRGVLAPPGTFEPPIPGNTAPPELVAPRSIPLESAPPPRSAGEQVFRGHTNRVVRVRFTPDGTRLVSASNGDHHVFQGNVRFHATGTDNSVRVWSIETGKEIHRFPMTEGRHYGPQGIALTADGRYVAVSSSWIWSNGPPEPRVYVWDLMTGQRKFHFDLAQHAIRSVAVSADGTRVSVARSGPGGISSWSLTDGRGLPNISLDRIPNAVEAPRMSWSPDGRYLLSGVWNGIGNFLVWDTSNGKVVKTFTGHTQRPTHIVMSNDGKRILSCAEDLTLRLWEWETGREIWRVDNLRSSVQCVAFAPTGNPIATGATDGTVLLRDATTGAEIRRLSGHAGSVHDVAFSVTGTAVASAGEDQTVRRWALSSEDIPASKSAR